MDHHLREQTPNIEAANNIVSKIDLIHRARRCYLKLKSLCLDQKMTSRKSSQ